MRRSARSRLEIAPAGLWRRLDTSHHPSTTIPAAISSRKICCSSNGTTEAKLRMISARKNAPITFCMRTSTGSSESRVIRRAGSNTTILPRVAIARTGAVR